MMVNHSVDRFLNFFDWGKAIVLDIKAFYMVWLADVRSPGFWYLLNDGRTASIEVGDKASNCSVRPGDGLVSWH